MYKLLTYWCTAMNTKLPAPNFEYKPEKK